MVNHYLDIMMFQKLIELRKRFWIINGIMINFSSKDVDAEISKNSLFEKMHKEIWHFKWTTHIYEIIKRYFGHNMKK
jgi:hypothetical protein